MQDPENIEPYGAQNHPIPDPLTVHPDYSRRISADWINDQIDRQDRRDELRREHETSPAARIALAEDYLFRKQMEDSIEQTLRDSLFVGAMALCAVLGAGVLLVIWWFL